MNKKFFVINLQDGNAVKTPLKSWWRMNNGPTDQISHALYFTLLDNEWKSEVVGNEVLLISPQANNGQVAEPRLLIEEDQNKEIKILETTVKMESSDVLAEVFSGFILSYNLLKKHRILRNQKDITGQLGEWVASVLFNATISENGINQFWDLIDTAGLKYQVKAHAKASTTLARWSRIDYQDDAPINFIVIIVFDPNYKLLELFKIPFSEAIRLRTGSLILNWSQVKQYRVDNLDALLYEKSLGFIAEK